MNVTESNNPSKMWRAQDAAVAIFGRERAKAATCETTTEDGQSILIVKTPIVAVRMPVEDNGDGTFTHKIEPI